MPVEHRIELKSRRQMALVRLFSAAAIVVSLGLSAQVSASWSGPSPESSAPGPYATSTTEYKMPARVDADVLDKVQTEIWGRVYWPTKLPESTTKHPLLMFLHGNHATCGSGSSPRNDHSCQYTEEGVCPAGSIVTPNHEGYNYVAEHLASWGYVVVSINANRGITCGGGDNGDWGLVLARGRLILKHLQYWSEWSKNGGAPIEFGNADLFKDRVELGEVGLMGHSRGGEGVRAALSLYRDVGSQWPTRIPGLDIKALYEIGAVDGQSDRTLNAESVAWNQLLPLCDGDVSDLQGRLPFERMTKALFLKKESENRPTAKSLSMVWGANHNFFNTEWQSNDSWTCSGGKAHQPLFKKNDYFSLEQQAIALQSMTAFFRAHVGSDRDANFSKQFDPAYSLPSGLTTRTRIDRDYIPGLDINNVILVEDFTAPTGKNPAGPNNLANGITIEHHDYTEPSNAEIAWEYSGDERLYQSNFKEYGQGADVSGLTYLDFRVGREYSEYTLGQIVDFSVQLVASDNSLSTPVAVSTYSRIQGPPNDNVELTQTVRIPIRDFTSVDTKAIRGVRFVFNKSSKAKIRLAQIRFGVTTRFLTEALNAVPPTDAPPTDALNAPTDSPLVLAAGGNGPDNAAPRLSANWLGFKAIQKSRFLRGGRGLEIAVRTADHFPVMDELPVLNISNKLFTIARYPPSGRTDVLIFSVPAKAVAQLPSSAKAQVQYGIKAPSRIWDLPDFKKLDATDGH